MNILLYLLTGEGSDLVLFRLAVGLGVGVGLGTITAYITHKL